MYKFNVNTNALSLITDQIDLPNGIALSPDEKSLYVNKMAFIDGNRKILKIIAHKSQYFHDLFFLSNRELN